MFIGSLGLGSGFLMFSPLSVISGYFRIAGIYLVFPDLGTRMARGT